MNHVKKLNCWGAELSDISIIRWLVFKSTNKSQPIVYFLNSVSLLPPIQETWQCGSSLPEVRRLKRHLCIIRPKQLLNTGLRTGCSEQLKGLLSNMFLRAHDLCPNNSKGLSKLVSPPSSLESRQAWICKSLQNKLQESPATRLFVSRKVTFPSANFVFCLTLVTFNVATHRLMIHFFVSIPFLTVS